MSLEVVQNRKPTPQHAGVSTTLRELVALRHASRGLTSGASRPSTALLAGPYRSAFQGRGMDFEEVRPYQPGDDVRRIDWRVTARTGVAHIKVFREERERPLWLLVDAGPAMHFGTRCAFKSVVAARAAALLAWSAIERGDRVGGCVLSPDQLRTLPPSARESRLFGLLGAIARATEALPFDAPHAAPWHGPSLDLCLERMQRTARSGSRVVVVSDFSPLGEAGRLRLARLARRTQLTCVFVYDALEAAPPPSGRYRITDGSSVTAFSSGGKRFHEAYCAHFASRRQTLEELCRRQRISLVALPTDGDPVAALRAGQVSDPREPGRSQ